MCDVLVHAQEIFFLLGISCHHRKRFLLFLCFFKTRQMFPSKKKRKTRPNLIKVALTVVVVSKSGLAELENLDFASICFERVIY